MRTKGNLDNASTNAKIFRQAGRHAGEARDTRGQVNRQIEREIDRWKDRMMTFQKDGRKAEVMKYTQR